MITSDSSLTYSLALSFRDILPLRVPHGPIRRIPTLPASFEIVRCCFRFNSTHDLSGASEAQSEAMKSAQLCFDGPGIPFLWSVRKHRESLEKQWRISRRGWHFTEGQYDVTDTRLIYFPRLNVIMLATEKHKADALHVGPRLGTRQKRLLYRDRSMSRNASCEYGIDAMQVLPQP